MTEEIIEDAKAAGLTISASGDILMEYYGDWIVITDALTKFAQLQAARQSNQRNEAVSDCARYQRLRILGCAPYGSKELEKGTVLRFQTLDSYLDKDIGLHPSRGEYVNTPPSQTTDILEEVIKILDGHIDRASTLGQQEEFREAQARIRNLIKQPESEGK